jgi:hypothetical protein
MEPQSTAATGAAWKGQRRSHTHRSLRRAIPDDRGGDKAARMALGCSHRRRGTRQPLSLPTRCLPLSGCGETVSTGALGVARSSPVSAPCPLLSGLRRVGVKWPICPPPSLSLVRLRRSFGRCLPGSWQSQPQPQTALSWDGSRRGLGRGNTRLIPIHAFSVVCFLAVWCLFLLALSLSERRAAAAALRCAAALDRAGQGNAYCCSHKEEGEERGRGGDCGPVRQRTFGAPFLAARSREISCREAQYSTSTQTLAYGGLYG